MGFSGVVFGELLVTFGIELPVYFNPVIIGVILSLIALYAGSKFGEISIEERNFQTHILKRPIEPNEKEEMVITRRYPGYLMISGVVIIMLTFIFYYWPLTLAM